MNKFCQLFCVLSLLSCKSDVVETGGSGSTSGRTTITTRNHYVFTFDRGGATILSPGASDSSADFDAGFIQTTPDGPEPVGICFGGYAPEMFHFVRMFGTLDSARIYFQNLATVTDTNFIWSTCKGQGFESPVGTEPNQVWTVQTRQWKYAKLLILSNRGFYPNTDSSYAEVSFDWVYQPDGSRTF